MNPPDTTPNGCHAAPVQEITIDDSEPGAVREIPITMPEGGWTIGTVAEKAGSGSPDSRVIWQFDAQDEHGGTLIVLASDPAGRTGSPRTVHIRFVQDDRVVQDDRGGDRASPPHQDDPIAVDPDGSDEDQDAYEIRTPTARYFYHKIGGGFSSLIDRDGNDWISYRRGNGPAGEYRGIPNMVYRSDGGRNNHFHPGHTEQKASAARLVHTGPLKVTIESSVDENRWQVRWEIYPDLARLTVLDIDRDDPQFWFLYEGTPGGRFKRKDRCLRSNGVDSRLSKKWEDRTNTIDWVAFRVPEQNRSLLLRLESELDVPVSYYPMAPMTVFGFGRKLGGVESFLSDVPTQITVRLLETSDPQEIETLATSGMIDQSAM